MSAILIVAALAALAFARGKARDKARDDYRQRVVGKSGTTWYVGSNPPDDANTVLVSVFSDGERPNGALAYESGQPSAPSALVIRYRQVTGPTAGAKIGDRFLDYQAPTALAALAIKDFLG